MLQRAKIIFPVVLLILSFVLLYHQVLVKLVQDWTNDDNYSHGFLVFPIALYFAWEQRRRLVSAIRQPSMFGLVVVAASLGILILGLVGSELFLTRVSLLGTIIGVVLFFYGWQHLKILAFPIAFLFLMVPIPRIIFDQLVFPLQLLASRLAEFTLSILNVPVLREGNLIVLANATLEVAEACSGLRSMISLLTLGIVYGYLADPRITVRIILALSTIPVAIIANGFRIAGTALAAQYYGAKAAEAFFDTFSGWVLFTIAFFLLFVVCRLLLWIMPLRPSSIVERPLAKERIGECTVPPVGKPCHTRAFVLAVLLLVTAIYMGDAVKTEAIPVREPLTRLPIQLAKWQGTPAPELSDEIRAKLGVDEYLSRFYLTPGHSQIHLYVGYYGSQREGDTIHSPKNCLPGAGWQPVKSGRIVVPVAANGSVQINRYVIQKGQEKQLVLYWYQSHGRVIASEYWAKFYLVMDAIRMNKTDGALVRVVSPISDSEKRSEEQSVDFVQEIFPHLNRHLPL